MKKKLLAWIFTAGVLLLGLSLAVGMLFAGPSGTGANERLSDAPALTDAQGNFNMDVLCDTAAWFSDHFFGRQEMISLNNWLSAAVFGTSGAEDVILGDDGWLYYGSTLDSYTGTVQLTDREIFSAARNLLLMQQYCQAQGKEFAFMLAPNKNSLYADAMPDFGVTADVSDAQRLMDALEQLGVSTVDLYAAFGAEEEVLYFAHDSHWNSKGAALGADCVNAAFGRKSSYFNGDFSQSQLHQGDLYEMLYPAFKDTESDPVYGGQLHFTYEGAATQPDSITLRTLGSGEGSLLCYRDSFGNLLYPYLADSFASCRFSRSNTYDLTWESDHVLIELVERNLSFLLADLPVMTAPERQLTLPQATGTVTVEITESKRPENTRLVKGTLPEAPDGDSSIYIVCQDAVYEAFCLENDSFGAYISADAQVQGVAYEAGGTLCLRTVQ